MYLRASGLTRSAGQTNRPFMAAGCILDGSASRFTVRATRSFPKQDRSIQPTYNELETSMRLDRATDSSKVYRYTRTRVDE